MRGINATHNHGISGAARQRRRGLLEQRPGSRVARRQAGVGGDSGRGEAGRNLFV